MASGFPVAVLFAGEDPFQVHQTLRRASLYQMDKVGVSFIHIQLMEKFKNYLMFDARVIYFIDMAKWHPVFLENATNIVKMTQKHKLFIRIDMFSLPLLDPWTNSGVPESIRYLDFLPLVSLHHFTPPYIFATDYNSMDMKSAIPFHRLLDQCDIVGTGRFSYNNQLYHELNVDFPYANNQI